MTRAENGGHRLWAMPGTYAASIGVNGYAPKTVDVTVPGPDLHVTMERAGTIVVTGVVPGASMLRLHGPGKRVVAIPPIMGRFGGLAAGVYKLDVVDAQKQVLETRDNITVTAGQTTTVTLR